MVIFYDGLSTFTVFIYAHAGDNTSAVSEKFLQQRLDSEARKAPDQQERGSMDAQLSKYGYGEDATFAGRALDSHAALWINESRF